MKLTPYRTILSLSLTITMLSMPNQLIMPLPFYSSSCRHRCTWSSLPAKTNLPLARLRVRDQLTELRAADLRFTFFEAAGFLNQVMGLNLSSEDIALLETRTEGWIAGLQLAAFPCRDIKTPASFIRSFTGSHHFVTRLSG